MIASYVRNNRKHWNKTPLEFCIALDSAVYECAGVTRAKLDPLRPHARPDLPSLQDLAVFNLTK